MCSLRFKNNFLTVECVRFDIEKDPIIKTFVRFRFDIVAITYMYHFNFVTLNAS